MRTLSDHFTPPDTDLAPTPLDRWGWPLIATCFGSLVALVVLYLTEPNLTRRVQNMPLLPNDWTIQDPRYALLWGVVGLTVLAMALLLLLELLGALRRARRP